MLPSRSSVTRLSGSGRSSDVSQKSSECRAICSSVKPGANGGAPAESVIGVELADERDVTHRVRNVRRRRNRSRSATSVFWNTVGFGWRDNAISTELTWPM